MNRNDDFNHTLEAWLRQQAPSQAPDRVLDASLERVATEPQRRGWLQRLLGGSRKATLTRAAAVTAVIAIAVLVGLQLSNLAPDVGGPSPSPMGSSSPSPAVVAPDNVLPPASLARVLQELEMREGPGTSGAVLATIAPGQTVAIVGSGEFGPVTTGGVTYYPAMYALNFAGWPAGVDGGFQGWVPTERDGIPLVELAPVACPVVDTPRPAVLAGMTGWARLSCYGSRELVLEGNWVHGSGGIWPWDGEPAWLVPPYVERAISDADGQFYFVLAPNVLLPAGLEAAGGRIRVTGHFDDPAAATCVIRAGEPILEQPAASVNLFCRERFVASSVELLEAPPAGCVNPPTDITTLIDMVPTRPLDPGVDPVACYGDNPLTFDATWYGGGVADCPAAPEPAWLACSSFSLQAAGDTRKVGAPQLFVAVDPSASLSIPSGPFPQVRVTGHFDDPAAQTCRGTQSFPGESPEPVAVTPEPVAVMIEGCRRVFVITDVVPL